MAPEKLQGTSPEHATEAKITPAEKEYLMNLYKGAWFINFENLPFKGGNKNPLNEKLKNLNLLRERSQSGSMLLSFYSRIKPSFDQENPIIKRVFLGELLKKLKPDQDEIGFVRFMRMMVNETKEMEGSLSKEIKELIGFLNELPPSPLKEKVRLVFLQMIGAPATSSSESNVFETDKNNSPGGETASSYGPLEGATPVAAGKEVMDVSKLDPFQIVLYKRLTQGFNEFVKKMGETNNMLKQKYYPVWFKLFKSKGILKAVNSLENWIIDTVNKMSISQGQNLSKIFENQISLIKFPSLPAKILWREFGIKAENDVKEKISGAKKTMELVSKFAPPLAVILSRKQMFRNGPNRAYLNRFRSLAYKNYNNSSGDKRLEYEFFTMILDSIKDDNELQTVIQNMKPILMQLFEDPKEFEQFSKTHFNKSPNELINSVSNSLLPSRPLTTSEKASREYGDMQSFLNMMLTFADIDAIKQKNQTLSTAITTICNNVLNIYVSLVKETNVNKVKEKIKNFIDGFEAIKKLLGEKGIALIEKKSPGLANMIRNPNEALSLLKRFSPPSVKNGIREFEITNARKQPQVVLTVLNKAEEIKKKLFKQKQFLEIKALVALSKGKTDYAIKADLNKINKDLETIRDVVNKMVLIWDEKSFAQIEPEIMNKLNNLSDRLRISDQSSKNMSFLAEHKVEEINVKQLDYNNLLHLARPLQKYINGQVEGLYVEHKQQNVFQRINEHLKRIVFTYCYQKQSDIEKENLDAYTFFAKPDNRKVFSKEIVKRINEFLNTVKLPDNSNIKEEIILISTLDKFEGNIDRYIADNILPKAKRAAELQAAKQARKPAQKTPS